ncbi:PP2C family protein-serine/threonine phosphatase [Streptomyces sp. NPDC001380]|uniref:PP2C family protein-serine/threonine phosphatase n=1 Tax=Streptomyces sp. NPDC001380 TaxID=3364566 RepID=UPI0036914B8E
MDGVRKSRMRLLLQAAEAFVGAAGVADVRRRVRDLVLNDLKPVYVGLTLLEHRGNGHRPGPAARRILDPEIDVLMETRYRTYTVMDEWPTARALRERRIVTVTSREELAESYGEQALDVWDTLGFASLAAIPLEGTQGAIGALIIAWGEVHELDPDERAVLKAVAQYTALATERALRLDDRTSVAHGLQKALLTSVPDVPGLDLAALYQPAAAFDLVGGDWYDAYRLPVETPDGPPRLAVTVGDITGHNTRAAAIMGQARSMLRQADIDHLHRGPAHAVTALERACNVLSLPATGTLVHAHLTRADEGWELRWSNAGHPPPLLAVPGRAVEVLHPHDRLLLPDLPCGQRTEHRTALPPGATLLLYTDGLVERRSRALDSSIEATGRLLQRHVAAGAPLHDVLRDLHRRIAADPNEDDVALLAVRVRHGAAP